MAKSVVTEFFSKVEVSRATLVLIGLVKKADDDNTAIQFSMGTSCANWVCIPDALIQTMDFLQMVACADHSHPLARITFKTPSSVDARSFAALADHLAMGHSAMSRVSATPASTTPHALHAPPLLQAPLQTLAANLATKPASVAGVAPCQWMLVFDVATNQYVYRCV